MKTIMTLILFCILSIAHANDSSFYSLKAKNLAGEDVDFSKYKGKVVLVVNTASRCGYTPQFDGLQKLYSNYKDKGFEVLGFPSNDFKQEDMEGKEIAKFCKLKYGVDFTMFKKSHVNGPERNDVFKYLVSKSSTPKESVRWNFEKFLVDKNGKVFGRYTSSVAPDNKKLLSDINSLLK